MVLFSLFFKCSCFCTGCGSSPRSHSQWPLPLRTPRCSQTATAGSSVSLRPTTDAALGSSLKTRTRRRCWRRSPGWRPPFRGARPCFSRWPPGCPGGEETEATSGGGGGGPGGSRRTSSPRASGKDPVAFWVEGGMRVQIRVTISAVRPGPAHFSSSRLLSRRNEIRASVILDVPVLGGRGAVPLPAVLEPVADLRGREPRGLGQVALPGRVGVRVLKVPLPQQAARSFLEDTEKHMEILGVCCIIRAKYTLLAWNSSLKRGHIVFLYSQQ